MGSPASGNFGLISYQEQGAWHGVSDASGRRAASAGAPQGGNKYCQVWQQVWGVKKEFRSRPRVSARAALAHERRAVTTLLIFCRGRAPQLGTEWIPRAPRRSHSLFLGAHRRPRHRPGCCSCSVGGRRRGTLDPRWLALMCGYINPFIHYSSTIIK